MDDRSLPYPRTTHEDEATRIREDACEHPERTPRQHEEAAQRIAAEEYCQEQRFLMVMGWLDPDEGQE